MFTHTDAFREWLLKMAFTDGVTRPTDAVVGLYNDDVDDPDRTATLTDLASEPTGGDYTRQTTAFSAGSTAANGGRWQYRLADVAFDVDGTTTDPGLEVPVDEVDVIDGYFVAWEAELPGQGDPAGTPSTHLMWTGWVGETPLDEWPAGEPLTLSGIATRLEAPTRTG